MGRAGVRAGGRRWRRTSVSVSMQRWMHWMWKAWEHLPHTTGASSPGICAQDHPPLQFRRPPSCRLHHPAAAWAAGQAPLRFHFIMRLT